MSSPGLPIRASSMFLGLFNGYSEARFASSPNIASFGIKGAHVQSNL